MPLLFGTRLVGGTSLALQYGHRNSVDLDFFGSLDEDLFAFRDCLESIGHVSIIKETKTIIDIYFLLQNFSLNEILGFYQKKYPEHILFRALMSLSYFDDAEKQMMPKMSVPDSWDAMKAYIIKEVEKIS